MSALIRFLGDTPLRVALKLLVVSFVVGLAMSAFGWTPFDVVEAARAVLMRIWNMGFAAFENALSYILLGAAIVVPAFLLIRLLSVRR